MNPDTNNPLVDGAAIHPILENEGDLATSSKHGPII